MITIDLQYVSPGATGTIAKSMLRPRDEPLGKTLARMRMLEAPPRGKASRRVTQEELLANAPAAALLDASGAPLSEDLLNYEAWSKAATLVLGANKIRIKYNLPTVTAVTAPTVVYAGMPAVCTGIKIIFSQQTPLQSEWYVADASGKVPPGAEPFATNSLVVMPKAEWAGRALIFRCRPSTDDAPWTEVTTPPVVLDDAGFLPMPRWKLLQQKSSPEEVRVVSYNVLHDSYATTKDALSRIYPFCTKDVLNILYRRSRIVQELQKYDGDIVCLQEVGRDVHERYFSEVLNQLGYRSLLAVKTGSTKEGCCIAFRRERFEPVFSGPVVMPLSWGTLSRLHPLMAAEIMADHPHLAHGLKKLPSVGIFIALKDKLTGRKVVVSNTHLYYHPDGCHIRALQFYVFMNALMEYTSKIDGGAEIIAAGDYNFTRITGGYRLATTGRVEADDTCWNKGLKHYFGMKKQDNIAEVLPQSEGEEEAVDGLADTDELIDSEPAAAAADVSPDEAAHAAFIARLQTPPTATYMPTLTLPRPLRDVHPTDDHLKYSNYALQFKECIDHIFVTEGLAPVRTLPPPSEEELAKDIAIPSLMFPSDHIALVADMRYLDVSPPVAVPQSPQ